LISSTTKNKIKQTKKLNNKNKNLKTIPSGVMVQTCNPSTQEAEAG
jgi:hypothetical protein